MSNKVDISNQALSWLGANLITSFGDGTTEANLCSANYDQLRDTVLEEGRWTFATKRDVLSTPLVTGPEWGFSYAHPINTKYLVVLQVRDDTLNDQGRSNIEWYREGDEIICDSTKIYVKVIQQVTDEKKFTRTFTQALAARMAAEFAIPLTESTKKEEQMLSRYDKKLAKALAIDGIQGTRERLRGDSLTRIR